MQQTFGQFAAHHASWHYHVSQQQINRAASLFPHLKSLAARRRFQHGIALDSKDTNNHFAQGILVFGDEHGFVAATKGGINDGLGFLSRSAARWQVKPESSALVWLALRHKPAEVRTHDAKHGGQAQAGAFANRFGGKEWFKDPAENLRVHAGASVGKGQTYEISIALLRVHWRWPAVDIFE